MSTYIQTKHLCTYSFMVCVAQLAVMMFDLINTLLVQSS